MEEEKPLYTDEEFRVKYNTSPEDHNLLIKKDKEFLSYYLDRGILPDLAGTPRGELEKKIQNLNPNILDHLKGGGLHIDSLHFVLSKANREDARRRIANIREE